MVCIFARTLNNVSHRPAVAGAMSEQKYFNIQPHEFVDRAADILERNIKNAISKFKEHTRRSLAATYGPGASTDDKTNRTWAALEQVLKNATERNLDRYELYIFRNLFVLPKGVDNVFENVDKLNEDAKGNEENMTEESITAELAELKKKKAAAKERVRAAQQARINAEKQIAKIRRFRKHLDDAKGDLAANGDMDDLLMKKVEIEDLVASTVKQLKRLRGEMPAEEDDGTSASDPTPVRAHKKQRSAFGNPDTATLQAVHGKILS